MTHIAPTILDAAGITPNTPQDGHLLLSTYSRDHLLTEYWVQIKDDSNNDGSGTSRTSSYVTPAKQYTEYHDIQTAPDIGKPTEGSGSVIFGEYYDLVNDPYQLTNKLYQATSADEQALGIPALKSQLAADRVS
ncbi:hypothetical protein ABZ865_41330 [Streptomyces sp. NPDC047085]|uniref:hypothetical protein n=1 Tax=Streptomyces sp. NPDC047085 TaxID=3155140 RepID=UPI00340FD485